MTNPFLIEGPAVISFSGGRTSGLMLHKILDVGIQPDVHVLFANTGKEREETLDFVHEIETRWKVPIHWNEFRDADPAFEEVSYKTASREGEPFMALLRKRNFLPNPVSRFCTEMMKIRVMRNWMTARGYDTWTNCVGLRADEMHRVARMNAANDAGRERWEVVCPLATAGLVKADVESFWASQPFDLRLRPWEGNCDLCFLKGLNRKLRVIRDSPDLAAWWVEAESLSLASKPSGARFRNDQPSYSAMLEMVRSSPMLPFSPADLEIEDDSIDCFCTN